MFCKIYACVIIVLMKYRVIANEDTSRGFANFGVDAVSVSSREQARKAFEKALADKSLGALIISQEVSKLIGEAVFNHERSKKLPQILVLDI